MNKILKAIAKRVAGFCIILLVTLLVFSVSLNVAGQEDAETERPELNIPVEPDDMPDYILEQLRNDPFVKKHFGWKLAFCQHPMYLLIDEDRGEPTVGERVPPWGAPNSAQYVERVKRNLKSLQKLSELKLNYQWSAVELESMVENFPEVYTRMKDLYKKGSLDFLDGTYSQAHLQVLGSESNWRQFEYGLEVYKRLFDKKTDIYARQETGLHLQLPQLLRKFGYNFATLPAFTATVEITEGTFEFITREGSLETVVGDEFVNAVGLDGSSIPTYLMPHIEEVDELQQDMFSTPRIIYEFPDLDEVDREKYEEYRLLFDWVLLKDALTERYKAAPPKAKARIFTDWSYVEGVWAEELLRKIRTAEESAVLTEQMFCMAELMGLSIDKREEIKAIWNTILKCQHHDISWIEVTDLRRKSINRLSEVIDVSNKMMRGISQKMVQVDDKSVTIFNGLPRERKCLIQLDGNIPSAPNSKFQHHKDKYVGFVSVPAGGFKSLDSSGDSLVSKKTILPEKMEAEDYIIKFSKEGLIEQITTAKAKNLLDCRDYLGGEIKARINKKWVSNRMAKIDYYTGPVCNILERSAKLGDIPLRERYYFFKNEPVVKAEIEFDFKGDEVGYFWIDKTKINIYYPTRGSDIYHDIPFGFVEAKQDRPLFATNWLYCGGLVYINRGTVKHWVKDGVIANVIGWGGNNFSNRLHWDWWVGRPQYDIRLYGKQKIEYFLTPCDEFDGAKIAQQVNDLISPAFVCKGKGYKSLYNVENKDLLTTSVYQKSDKIWARGYKLPSDAKSEYSNWEIFNAPIEKLK